MKNRQKIVVLTGAGMSAESGLKTFRDSDGLWEGYAVEDVATPRAWKKDPQLVLDFYNERRRQVTLAQPNAAHKYLASLERDFEVTIITQNIDDLHERAGSTDVLHLHGEIFKMCSERDKSCVTTIRGDMQLNHLAEDGYRFRPAIVWFEEPVPMMDQAVMSTLRADIFIVIGTSLQVYPAAGLLQYAPGSSRKIILDKKIPSVARGSDYVFIERSATEGISELAILLGERENRIR